MKTPEIPTWVIEYNNANHQSSAGRAIKILIALLTEKDNEINGLKDDVDYLKGVIKQTERDAAREIDKYRDT